MPETPRLTSPKEVRALLEKLGHRPNKGLGQNFLIDANILDIIAETADIRPEESVLEVGPGLGALTERILPRAKSVTCIEKDPVMVGYLLTRFLAGGIASPLSVDAEDGVPPFQLIQSDALDVDLEALFASGITKVAANLPYSVASRVMVDMAECAARPERMALTIQKEVADRLTAPPGNKHYGILSILMGTFYECRLVKKISPTCFLPPPKVWSAVVALQRRAEPLIDPLHYPAYKQLVKSCFSQRRKQLGTLLKRSGTPDIGALLERVGIEPSVRPECVSIEAWARLTEDIARDAGSKDAKAD